MAFKENGMPEKEQEITIKGLYSEGLNDNSDFSALRHSHELNNVAIWINSDICKNLMVAEDGIHIEPEAISETLASIPLFHSGGSSKGTFRLRGKES